MNRRVRQWIDTWDSSVQSHWVLSGPTMSEKAPEMMAKCKQDIDRFRIEFAADQLAAAMTDDDVFNFLGEVRQWAKSLRKTQPVNG